jgi:uncharacterized hydrophobic protein (TIGR00271 family)
MRQVLVQVPLGVGDDVVVALQRHNATNVSRFAGHDAEGEDADIIIAHLTNAEVGPFIGEVDSIDKLRLNLIPAGVLTLMPPEGETPNQITDVSRRSAFEIYMDGLQSIGSWKGFLSYAGAAGIVVWLGLFTNTSYLLVAAMLIAPFAGPAMNAAIATARGDFSLLWHSISRYAAALGVSALVAALLSLLFRQEIPTQQMASIANISSAAAILPLAAGAAGALHLCQAERSSLVSGASVGMLVAASLAPPTGLVGMGTVIGRWDMVVSGLFLLGLQLVGINTAGAVVFRLYGRLEPVGPRYGRGRAWVAWTSIGVTLVGLLAVVSWQFGSADPDFRRATIEQRVRVVIGDVIEADPQVRLAEASVRFTRTDIEGQDTLLAVVYVQRESNASADRADLEERLGAQLRDAINQRGYNLTPLVAVTVLDTASTPRSESLSLPGRHAAIDHFPSGSHVIRLMTRGSW